MRLELSRKAQADLDDVRDHSVPQFGPLRTINCLDLIEEGFRRILVYSQTGVVHAGPRSVRSSLAGKHRIYCQVAAEDVIILLV